MKGLFVKDIELMKQQKQFFILVVVMEVILNLAGSGSVSFATGYFTIVTAIFAITTISYDEFDNGLAFLMTLPHYSISIIRGRGIDDNAMKYLLEKYRPQQILFVDGWIGKGAILNELKKDISAYEGVSADIAVVADPANVTELCGTHEDILIPSSCLNSTVSGLISRTFLRDDIIGRDDFHGAVYYGELTDSDLSYDFIETIEKEFNMENTPDLEKRVESQGIDEVINIGKNFGIDDINLIKPGIGETTRVLLRRIPWKVLIDERYKGNPQLEHIVRLAEEKHTPVEYYPLIHYKCCGIIKKLADA